MFCGLCVIFFFKQKTAYDMRISDWSSDVCSSDLGTTRRWVMGRDGVKRWADTNESVEDQRKFRGSGELERAGYIPAGSADEREGVTPNTYTNTTRQAGSA